MMQRRETLAGPLFSSRIYKHWLPLVAWTQTFHSHTTPHFLDLTFVVVYMLHFRCWVTFLRLSRFRFRWIVSSSKTYLTTCCHPSTCLWGFYSVTAQFNHFQTRMWGEKSFQLYQYYKFVTYLTVDKHTHVWLSALTKIKCKPTLWTFPRPKKHQHHQHYKY